MYVLREAAGRSFLQTLTCIRIPETGCAHVETRCHINGPTEGWPALTVPYQWTHSVIACTNNTISMDPQSDGLH